MDSTSNSTLKLSESESESSLSSLPSLRDIPTSCRTNKTPVRKSYRTAQSCWLMLINQNYANKHFKSPPHRVAVCIRRLAVPPLPVQATNHTPRQAVIKCQGEAVRLVPLPAFSRLVFSWRTLYWNTHTNRFSTKLFLDTNIPHTSIWRFTYIDVLLENKNTVFPRLSDQFLFMCIYYKNKQTQA